MIPCTGCHRRFRNSSGLKRHFNAIHAYHPGLDVPVINVQRDYHPFLTGMLAIFLPRRLLIPTPPQPTDVMKTEQLSPPMRLQCRHKYGQRLIGPHLIPAWVSNSQISSFPKRSYRKRRPTASSSSGLPRLSHTVPRRLLPTMRSYCSKSIPFHLGTFPGNPSS
jgi:hypothetical protein